MKKVFSFFLIFLALFQGCKKSSNPAPEHYYIKFNIGSTSYLINDILNVLSALNLGPYSSRMTYGGDTKEMFQIGAYVGSASSKDSANSGFYTLVTTSCLVATILQKTAPF